MRTLLALASLASVFASEDVLNDDVLSLLQTAARPSGLGSSHKHLAAANATLGSRYLKGTVAEWQDRSTMLTHDDIPEMTSQLNLRSERAHDQQMFLAIGASRPSSTTTLATKVRTLVLKESAMPMFSK